MINQFCRKSTQSYFTLFRGMLFRFSYMLLIINICQTEALSEDGNKEIINYDEIKVTNLVEVEVKPLRIPLPDGINLHACMWYPISIEQGEKFPVLLWYDPYAAGCKQSERFTSYAKAGYVVMYVHIRGTGLSEGVFPDREYSTQELDDAIYIIGWLSKQVWSTGNVGMFGESWSGFNALQVAMRKPPALKAIIAAVATENIYHEDVRFTDGIPVFSDWTIIADTRLIFPPSGMNPFDEQTLRNRFDQDPWSLIYLKQQRDGEFWRIKNRFITKSELIEIPTMMIGGWYDGMRTAILRTMKNIKAPFKAIVGPWDHSYRHPEPKVDIVSYTLKWWDYWLKGIQNGVLDEPSLHVYMRKAYQPGPRTAAHPGFWTAISNWPPAGYNEKLFYLQTDRKLSGKPNKSDIHKLKYVPNTGIQAGIWWGDIMPDQRPADAYSLVYETEPFEEEINLLGMPKAKLNVSAPVPHANWFVRLCDVAPDGTVTLITGAGKNGTHRNSSEHPEPLIPDEPFELEIQLHFTSWIFEPGHKMRVVISNAQWPAFWTTPYNMTTSLMIGGNNPSYIIIPVVAEIDFELSEPVAKSLGSFNLTKEEALKFPPSTGAGWIGPAKIERDEINGCTTVSYTVGSTSKIYVEYQSWDNEPHKARYFGSLSVTTKWNEDNVILRGETEVISDSTNFYYKHSRKLFRNDDVIREKFWEDIIPRDFQ